MEACHKLPDAVQSSPGNGPNVETDLVVSDTSLADAHGDKGRVVRKGDDDVEATFSSSSCTNTSSTLRRFNGDLDDDDVGEYARSRDTNEDLADRYDPDEDEEDDKVGDATRCDAFVGVGTQNVVEASPPLSEEALEDPSDTNDNGGVDALSKSKSGVISGSNSGDGASDIAACKPSSLVCHTNRFSSHR